MFGLRLRLSCVVGLPSCGSAQNCVGVMGEPAGSTGSTVVASCWFMGGTTDVSSSSSFSSSDVISVRNLLASSMS